MLFAQTSSMVSSGVGNRTFWASKSTKKLYGEDPQVPTAVSPILYVDGCAPLSSDNQGQKYHNKILFTQNSSSGFGNCVSGHSIFKMFLGRVAGLQWPFPTFDVGGCAPTYIFFCIRAWKENGIEMYLNLSTNVHDPRLERIRYSVHFHFFIIVPNDQQKWRQQIHGITIVCLSNVLQAN